MDNWISTMSQPTECNGTIKERKGASSSLKAGLQLFWDEHKHKCKHKC